MSGFTLELPNTEEIKKEVVQELAPTMRMTSTLDQKMIMSRTGQTEEIRTMMIWMMRKKNQDHAFSPGLRQR